MNQEAIGFIGSGNMAYAISGKLENDKVYLYDINYENYARFEVRGATGLKSIDDLIKKCNFIFLSIKPQNFKEVLTEIKSVPNHNHCVYISIAAGISIEYITSFLGEDCSVVRAMPNTPLMIGSGCTALCSRNVSVNEFAAVEKIFSNSGITQVIPEEKMNEVIALNGSSPAYVYYFVESMIDGAVALGFDAQTAKKMACATVKGAVDMILETEIDTTKLIDMVCSKGGTTIAAMDVLRAKDFKGIIIDAMNQCTKRAKEMAR